MSVGYSTFAFPASEGSATAGADFTPVQGRLTWADGDDSEREIAVPIIADASGAEQPETFEVQLNDVQGGGLALDRATVNILGDAFPAGMFRIEARAVFREDEGSVLVIVHREDYSQGEVSVLVRVTGGTAQEGSDYRFPAPVRLTWRDGEWDSKTAAIVLVNDSSKESQETIEVSLSDATGGALIGTTRSVTVAVNDDDSVVGGSRGGGGGAAAEAARTGCWRCWLPQVPGCGGAGGSPEHQGRQPGNCRSLVAPDRIRSGSAGACTVTIGAGSLHPMARRMTRTLKSDPRRDGYRMPGEFEPHAGCWMLWPERPDNWRLGGKPAQQAFVAVASAIAGSEPVSVGASAAQYRERTPPAAARSARRRDLEQ